MINSELLKEKIKSKNLSLEYMANELNISVEILNQKINGECEFIIRELVKINNILDLTSKEMENIFSYDK
ncbi:hypothetical protein [Oceanivirga salmonicida]|uniref:hypothetical protein n=1 Tax=Oceanivirga salmonicida TaxID=1769291 RepID=UPI0008322C90|nr:hypothetical protein [Oceanivirga salmonicida]